MTVLTSDRYQGASEVGGVKTIQFARKWGLLNGFRLLFLCMKCEFDIINVHHTPALYGFWFRVMLCIINIITPVVVSFHTLHGATLKTKIESVLLLMFCRGFISMNEEVTKILKNLWLTKRKEFTEIPIGSNVTPASDAIKDRIYAKSLFGIDADTLLIANFGLFYPGRGLETLCEACRLLKKQTVNFVVFLLGAHREEDKEYITKIVHMIDQMGFKKEIRLTGFLDENMVSQHLYASDICVVPYDRGVSIRRTTLMAGLSHGLPTITTQPETPSKYIKDGQNMILVPPRDPSALMKTIMDLWKNPEQRAKLGEQALTLSVLFNWPSISQRTVDEYLRFLRRRK